MQLLRSFNQQQAFVIDEVTNADFYREGKSPIALSITLKLKSARADIDSLKASSLLGSDTKKMLDEVGMQTARYQSHFDRLVSLTLRKGFKDWGMVGVLRSHIHDVENDKRLAYNPASMLTLRRYEKDFLLRKDVKYLQKFNLATDDFVAELEQLRNPQNEQVVYSVIEKVKRYTSSFREVVEIEEQIGFSDGLGVKGAIAKDMQAIRRMMPRLKYVIDQQIERIIKETVIILLAIFAIQLALGLIFGFFFSKKLSLRISRTAKSIERIASGKRLGENKVKDEGTDELSQANRALDHLQSRIAIAADFAAEIGSGNLDVEYPKEYQNGQLEEALLKMKQDLQDVKNGDKLRSWTSDGLMQINDLIVQYSNDDQTLCQQALSHMIRRTDSHQGAIYVTRMGQQGEKILKLVSSYAYKTGTEKDAELEEIAFGDKLVGQAAKNQEVIKLDNLPEDYIKLSSGLGHANPASLICVPMMARQQVVGVLEIASLHQLEAYKVEYLQKSAENIALTLLHNRALSAENQLIAASNR